VLGKGGINDLAKTPNFDKLAKEGVLFKNAFVNAPSCTPCRSSLLSGRNFWETGRGAILIGAEWDETIATWPLLLQKSGYHLGYTYKVWSPGNPRDAGIGGNANAFVRQEVNSMDFPSMYLAGPEELQLVEKIDKAKVIEKTKKELYREARGNFSGFLEQKKG
jgi:hypothetical protein